jgi:hypothetical protein
MKEITHSENKGCSFRSFMYIMLTVGRVPPNAADLGSTVFVFCTRGVI